MAVVSSDAVAEIITGAGPGGGPHVKVFSDPTGNELGGFFAYTSSFSGGVRVATGDVNGDGLPELLTATGPEATGQVRWFSGATGVEAGSLLPYSDAYRGGVFVAAGDVNGDGFDDIVTGADAGGGPHVKVFSGQTSQELANFFAFDASFTGGVRVAAGDVSGDGHADLVTAAGPGGGPHVKVFDGQNGGELASFLAYDRSFSGGVHVAAGDVTGDGIADIITGAGAGGGPHVKVFDGQSGSELTSFVAYDPSFTGGVRVAAGDVTGDGVVDIITGAGPGGGPHVKVFDGQTGSELGTFFAYNPSFTGGVYVAAMTLVPEPSGLATLAIATATAGAVLRRRR